MKICWTLIYSMSLLGCGAAAAAPTTGTAAAGSSVEAPPVEHSDAAAHTAPGTGASEKCDHLAHACHDHAAFSALTNECHKLGHGGDAAQCESRHDECILECEKASKSGTHAHPGGGH